MLLVVITAKKNFSCIANTFASQWARKWNENCLRGARYTDKCVYLLYISAAGRASRENDGKDENKQ